MIIEKLLTEALDTLLENIPQDLLAAYQRATAYDSQRNPQSLHTELNLNPNINRKTIRYDYGKASYEEISAEQAINLIKQDKSNASKLRIIFDGKLVEYELRDNGNIYAIYGDVDHRVTINDKSYRNIRYAPWRAVLQNADKIYVTDEYDKLITADMITARSNEIDAIGSMDTKNPEYQRHAPADSSFKKNLRFNQSNPDTGKHIDTSSNEYSDKYEKNYINTDQLVRHYDSEHVATQSSSLTKLFNNSNYELSTMINNYFKNYNKLKYDKQVAYINYNAARKAYKKILRDKDDYTESEFASLEQKFKNKKDQYLAEYNKIAKEFANERTRVISTASKDGLIANNKISDYAADVQRLAGKLHEIERKIEDELRKAVNTEDSGRMLDYESRRHLSQIKTYSEELEKAQEELKRKKAALLASEKELVNADIANLEVAIQDYLAEIAAAQEMLEQGQKARIAQISQRVAQLEREYQDANNELETIKPIWAARQHQNAERNQGKLDPRLINLIDFVDYE